MLVHLEFNVAFACFDDNRHDLFVKAALILRLGGATMRLKRQRVLIGTRNAELVRHVLCRHAHVHATKRVRQRADHQIRHGAVAHARAKTLGLRQITATAHTLSAAADRHLGITQQNRLRSRDDGLQTRTAQTVDVKSGRRMGQTTIDRNDARQIHIAWLSLHHMAKSQMSDLRAIHARALKNSLHDGCAQIARSNILQSAAKIANRSSRCSCNKNFTHRVLPEKNNEMPSLCCRNLSQSA